MGERRGAERGGGEMRDEKKEGAGRRELRGKEGGDKDLMKEEEMKRKQQ